MILKIIKFPNPVLRKKAKPVKKVTPEIVKLIDDMIETMHAAPGVGLAAPQVNRSIQVIVVDPGAGPLALVNPKILEKSGCQVFTEGCLCLPGVEAPVERASHVKVKALDRDGQAVTIETDGFLATILQHEIDHLAGIVFIDKVKNPALIKYVPRTQEKKEELL
ncbi:MAG: peptide deformylase [Candidatus Margulisbacteria bacterium]|nr:peptide deformylase [Candidatus Margulisiibacteriota bacterium]